MQIERLPSERNSRRLRVAAYIRVSTGREEQDGSFEAQAEYYENWIRSHDDWEFAGIYGEKVSGTHAGNRPEHSRIVADALDRKIDLIYCKSVSRWARNAIDALDSVKLLTGNGVHLVFEQENIDTRKAGVILQLSLSAAVAQNESESISENIKLVYRNRAKKGAFKAHRNRYFGYSTDDGFFTPDGNAKYVPLIYRMFLDGFSPQEIADEMDRRGVLTNRGTDFTRYVISDILQNEIYVGDIHICKTPQRNVITKEPDPEQYSRYIRDHHEALVDRETWEKAQRKMGRRMYRQLQDRTGT